VGALIIDAVLEKVDRYLKIMNILDRRFFKAVDTHAASIDEARQHAAAAGVAARADFGLARADDYPDRR